jgi:hypothetical protein
MVQVQTYSLEFLIVSWSIAPLNRDLNDFTFSIYRSQGQHPNDFVLVKDGLKSTFTWKDTGANQLSKHRKWFYKIRATEDDTGDYAESKIEGNPEIRDRTGISIIRRQEMLLRTKVGVPAFVVAERTTGQRCDTCWDEVKQRVSKANCDKCYNTGFIKGFMTPIQANINFNPSPKVVQIMGFGELQPNQTTAWMGPFPEVKPRDIIVEEGVGTRWRVVQTSTTRKRRLIIHQNLVLKEINRSDVEWEIPIPELIANE